MPGDLMLKRKAQRLLRLTDFCGVVEAASGNIDRAFHLRHQFAHPYRVSHLLRIAPAR